MIKITNIKARVISNKQLNIQLCCLVGVGGDNPVNSKTCQFVGFQKSADSCLLCDNHTPHAGHFDIIS